MGKRTLMVGGKHIRNVLFFPEIYALVIKSLSNKLLLYRMLPDETRLECISHALRITHTQVTRCMALLANSGDVASISQNDFIRFVVNEVTKESIDRDVTAYIENVLVSHSKKVSK